MKETEARCGHRMRLGKRWQPRAVLQARGPCYPMPASWHVSPHCHPWPSGRGPPITPKRKPETLAHLPEVTQLCLETRASVSALCWSPGAGDPSLACRRTHNQRERTLGTWGDGKEMGGHREGVHGEEKLLYHPKEPSLMLGAKEPRRHRTWRPGHEKQGNHRKNPTSQIGEQQTDSEDPSSPPTADLISSPSWARARGFLILLQTTQPLLHSPRAQKRQAALVHSPPEARQGARGPAGTLCRPHLPSQCLMAEMDIDQDRAD